MVNHPNRSRRTTREAAVQFAMREIMRSTDWQEVQNAMANDDVIRAWLDSETGGSDDEAISICQSVISDAEEQLGNEMPANYA